MSLKTKDLSPRIGSEVETNAKTLLSGAHAEEIRELLEQRGVLVFHDINFTDEEMASFAETLGNIQGGSTYKGSIFKVTFDPEHNPHGETYLMGAQEWHIDRTDIDVPPLGSMLTPRVLATKGGQTDFANTYAAYEDLPEEEKRYLEGLGFPPSALLITVVLDEKNEGHAVLTVTTDEHRSDGSEQTSDATWCPGRGIVVVGAAGLRRS